MTIPGDHGRRLRAIAQLDRLRLQRQAALDAIDRLHPAHLARLALEADRTVEAYRAHLQELARFDPARVHEILASD